MFSLFKEVSFVTANEARELVSLHQSQERLLPIYDKIRESASQGYQYIHVPYNELTETDRNLLKKNGFRVILYYEWYVYWD